MQFEVNREDMLALFGFYKPYSTYVHNIMIKKFMVAFVKGISDNKLHVCENFEGNIAVRSNCDSESYAEMEKFSKALSRYKHRFGLWRLIVATVYSLIRPKHCNFFIPENRIYEVMEWVSNNCSIYEYAFSTKYKTDITLCLEHKKGVMFKLWFNDK